MSEKQQLISTMRKSAVEFRKHAAKIRGKNAVKCAQVLTAARGLSQFQRILGGAER